jgi:hypothetical protein
MNSGQADGQQVKGGHGELGPGVQGGDLERRLLRWPPWSPPGPDHVRNTTLDPSAT